MFDLHSPISSSNRFPQPSQLPCFLNQDRYDIKFIVITNHLHKQNLMRNACGQIRLLFSIILETQLNSADVFHTKTMLHGWFSLQIQLQDLVKITRIRPVYPYIHIPKTAGNCKKNLLRQGHLGAISSRHQKESKSSLVMQNS